MRGRGRVAALGDIVDHIFPAAQRPAQLLVDLLHRPVQRRLRSLVEQQIVNVVRDQADDRSPVGQALACPFCYGAKDGKSTEHMAVAIWFLFGAVISVLGGIGAFSFHLWRHGRMPAEPYQEITEEDLSKYE